MILRTAAIALASLILCTCTMLQKGAELAPGSRYVSLGSSFAAGAGIGPIRPGTPERCGRTINNYASLLAERLELALDDQGCGGAKSEHILGPWNEVPAQIEAVTPDTKLVTVTIGGNDLNYIGTLFAMSCSPNGKSLVHPTESCREAALPGGDLAQTEKNLRAIAVEVKRRAPQATLVFVQYVILVPETLCDAIPLTPAAADIAREIGNKLAAVTQQVAHESGAIVVATDQLSRNHTTCDSQPWATGLPLNYDRSVGAPWHPNAAGHAAIAEAIADQIAD